VRSRKILEELARRHAVTLVGLAWNDEDVASLEAWRSSGVEVHIVDHRRRAQLGALARHPYRPLQGSISRSATFARTVRELIWRARAAGRPFDALHVEHYRAASAVDLFQPIEGVRVVYDAVDCLAALAELTSAHSPNAFVKRLARLEAGPTRDEEDALLMQADAITVVAERDRAAMLRGRHMDHVHVVPNGVDPSPQPATLTRDPVAVFSGKLSYHANQAAVSWLLADIWPEVRRLAPDARLCVAGADPPRWLVDASGRDGVEIIANPRDMTAVLAASRVAVAPVVYSVGIQNKVLEAMAAGLPVVATRSAGAGLLPPSSGTFALADEPFAFAGEVARLLDDDAAAMELGRNGHEYVRRYHSWTGVVDRFEQLYLNSPVAMEVA
jgi:glycosyltransferase involved in cell wall biosynthesis